MTLQISGYEFSQPLHLRAPERAPLPLWHLDPRGSIQEMHHCTSARPRVLQGMASTPSATPSDMTHARATPCTPLPGGEELHDHRLRARVDLNPVQCRVPGKTRVTLPTACRTKYASATHGDCRACFQVVCDLL